LIAQSKLVDLYQLKKDIFVFKFSKVKAQCLLVMLMRYKNNTGNAVGMFPIFRGDHVATELKSCLGNTSAQLLCYTEWHRSTKKQTKLRIVVGGGQELDKENTQGNPNSHSNPIPRADESELSSIEHQSSMEKDTARGST
jgi:hypothetical protein